MTRKSRADLEVEVKELKSYVSELEDKLDTIADLVGEEEDEDDEDSDEDDDDGPAGY